jgi:ADP-ribosyl-[dinitrogen reductase] hydrolase
VDLTTAQLDRACGILLAAAAGDALGAEYPSDTPPIPDAPVALKRGRRAPGEWSDATSAALVIAEMAATGSDLRTESARDAIRARWARQGAGSNPLVHAAVVALAFLDDSDGLTEAATAISALTVHDAEAAEACVLWCHAVRHAVLTGELDVRAGLERLPGDSRPRWAERLREAERAQSKGFGPDGRLVESFQAAWSAIITTPVPEDEPAAASFRADHLRLALENAVRGGRDTVAAAGALLGAAYGASAVPARRRLELHGRTGLKARDLVGLATTIATGGTFAPPVYGGGYRPAVSEPHPDDPGLLLADIAALRDLPAGVTAVVSLCLVDEQRERAILERTPHWLEVRLIDTDDPAENQNLDFVLHDTVTAIERLRADGHVVLVHCVAAYSRTPTIGALYAMRRTGASPSEAIAAMERALPEADPTDAFRKALRRAQAAHPPLIER